MKNYLNLLSVLAISLLVSACATDGVRTDGNEAVSPNKDVAVTYKTTTLTATVKAIDLPSRKVTITGPEGNTFVVQAGKEVRNLAQVKAGDKIVLEYIRGLGAEVIAPGSPNEPVINEAVARANPGERPAGAAGTAITEKVVIQKIDVENNIVQFKDAEGDIHEILVKRPEFRAMLKNLKPGDHVAVTYFEALAISVTPAGN